MILLGAVLSMLAPAARQAALQRRRSEARRLGVLELSNVLERLVAQPASAPAVGQTRSQPVSAALAADFPEGAVTVQAAAVAGDVPSRRLDATLTWTRPNAPAPAPLRLSAFLFETPTANAGETP